MNAEYANLFSKGEQQAGIIITGAHWEEGMLIPNAGNAGKALP